MSIRCRCCLVSLEISQCFSRRYLFSNRVSRVFLHIFQTDDSRIHRRTYLITTPIIPYYYTQLIGDARNPPTLLAAATFDGFAVIGGFQFYHFSKPTLNFLIQIRTHIFPVVLNTFKQPIICTFHEFLCRYSGLFYF